jgi:predicted short-subunit dehydrogenase-like oxidoreductase (DUF2520 family)
VSLRIAIIGGGNVATHFFRSLGEPTVKKIFVRKKEENKHLPQALLSESKDLRALHLSIIIIAVLDDQIINVLTNYHFHPDQIILHTAGSVDIDVIHQMHPKSGVIYPLMTMFKEDIIDYEQMPLLIEGSSESDLLLITRLAESISNRVAYFDSEERKIVHLAAVIANNFTTSLLLDAVKILKKNHLDKHLLLPLMKQTIQKAFSLGGIKSMTGPAVRNDQRVIEAQLSLLSHYPETLDLYQFFTHRIKKSKIDSTDI